MMDPGGAIAAARPRVVAALAARFRDLDLAEDAFSDAAEAALSAWIDAPPRDPAGWLWRAAWRRAIDARRRAEVRTRLRPEAPPPPETPEAALLVAESAPPDERLGLIFTCCHPVLAPEARVLLTLKVVCGLSAARLARAFLTTEPAVRQRLTRAKRRIAEARAPFELPDAAALPERLLAVLATLEVAYAQAHADAALADPETAPFAAEVLRLTGILAELMPQEPEVLALAALVRFSEARRPARLDADGAMAPLLSQDPRLWQTDLIHEAALLLHRAAAFERSGPYQLMAAIHAAHCAPKEGRATPWGDIVRLYDLLLHVRPGPVAAVNRAVALAELQGAEAGLSALENAAAPADWLPLHAARAHLLAQAGRRAEAIQAVRTALALEPAPAERRWLERRLADLSLALPFPAPAP